jgi:hypothetical protein
LFALIWAELLPTSALLDAGVGSTAAVAALDPEETETVCGAGGDDPPQPASAEAARVSPATPATIFIVVRLVIWDADIGYLSGARGEQDVHPVVR